MGFGFRNGVCEIIYAMITARPDIAYKIVRAAQHSACPHEIHYNGIRRLFKYMYQTRKQGIYYWRTEPNLALPEVAPPGIDSNFHDMGGGAIHLAGGAVAYKVNLLQTIAQSSTEAEYMEATTLGKIILHTRSIMWDLGIPQLAATTAYKDNDAATSMANARRPSCQTRHVDIKWHVL